MIVTVIIGLLVLFYTAFMYLKFKCHNHDCYHNRDILGLKIVISKILPIVQAYIVFIDN